MRLICISRFRGSSPDGGEPFDFMPGQDINVTEDVAAHLLHRSPSSFKWPDPEPEPTPKEPDNIGAMSTETATGLTAPDRRARGGKKRRKGKT